MEETLNLQIGSNDLNQKKERTPYRLKRTVGTDKVAQTRNFVSDMYDIEDPVTEFFKGDASNPTLVKFNPTGPWYPASDEMCNLLSANYKSVRTLEVAVGRDIGYCRFVQLDTSYSKFVCNVKFFNADGAPSDKDYFYTSPVALSAGTLAVYVVNSSFKIVQVMNCVCNDSKEGRPLAGYLKFP